MWIDGESNLLLLKIGFLANYSGYVKHEQRFIKIIFYENVRLT